MTGDIKEKLLASDAVKSLRMEHDVYSYMKSLGLDASHGWYYKDRETGKLREIDIYVRQFLEKPRRYRGVGSPGVSIDIFIECKTSPGHNILLSDSAPNDYDLNTLAIEWFGQNEYLYDITSSILENLGMHDDEKLLGLYAYLKERAYPGSRAINADIKITKPPVEVMTTAFRDTKAGRTESESSFDQASASPLWNAIRATKSAVDAAKAQSREAQLSWVVERRPRFEGRSGFVELLSFFFDAELMRMLYFHPVVLTESRLWLVTADSMREVNSARVYIEGVHEESFSVDVVSAAHSRQYLAKATQHFERQSIKSIRNLWKTMEQLEWFPGTNAKELSEVLGIALRDEEQEASNEQT